MDSSVKAAEALSCPVSILFVYDDTIADQLVMLFTTHILIVLNI